MTIVMNYTNIHNNIDDFDSVFNSDLIDHNYYYYYECFVDENRKFNYYITEFGKIMNQKSTMIKISKSIPRFFHKSILYFYYIPKYF
jgi:hypothetical protein